MPTKSDHHYCSPAKAIGVLLLVSAAVLLWSPFIGVTDLSLDRIWDQFSGSMDAKIFWQMRLPRVLVGFLVGGTLAICGMVFQAIFRNPLVDPSTLGLSAGAAFGAALYIWLNFSFSILGFSGIVLFAFIGAIVSMVVVWHLSYFHDEASTIKMLLAGVAVSFFFVSLIMMIQYLSDIGQSFRITRWLMGSLYVFGYEPLQSILPFTVAGLVLAWYFSHELNLFMMGEEIAISRGVEVRWMVKILFVLISLIIAGLVAVSGPIGFVGIMAPHVCRLIVGSDHRVLTPVTFLMGGIILGLCDSAARVLVAPAEIPVGIITALWGGPFFLWLLKTR